MVAGGNDGIFVIDTQPLGYGELVASFLVVGSKSTALIDPGFPSSLQSNIVAIERLGIDPASIGHIVLTHSHIDHAGAVGALAQVAKGARIVAHQRGAFYLRHSIKIAGGSQMVFGAELAARLGTPIDVPVERIDTIGEGDVIDLGDKRLRVFYTPGHCGDHVSLLEESTGTLFPGDTACLHYPQLGHVLIPAGSPPIYRTDEVLEELKTLAGADVRRVLTPHFGEPDSTPADFLADNIETVRRKRDEIEAMFRDGLEFPQVVEKIRSEVLQQSGVPEADIPEFLGDVWLRLMLKTGLMGYMADILQYARDIRSFSHNTREMDRR